MWGRLLSSVVSAPAAALWDLGDCSYTLEGNKPGCPQSNSWYSQLGLPPLWEGPRTQDGIPSLDYLTPAGTAVLD